MAFSLANFGLAAGGARDVLNERVSRERADQDREYQLAKRKREEDDALIKQEEAKRDRAYAEELRATLPKYLSGGANASPAQPAVPGEVLDPFAVDGGEVARTAQPAKPAGDNTEGLYKALQDVAAKHGRLDHYEAMKKRIKTAADEGVIDFIAKARQGLPETELLASFNQNGKVKLKGLRRAGEDEFAAVTEDGQPIRLNLTSLTESLLAPKDLLIHRDKGEKTAAVLEARRLTAEQQDRANAARSGEREARILLATTQADLAAARADRVRNPVENWTAFDNEIRKAASDLSTTSTEDGKKAVDYKRKAALVSMAQEMARRNPEAYSSPTAAVDAAMEKLDEIRGVQDKAADQAEQESAGLNFDTPAKRQAWIKSRAERLTKTRLGQGEARSAPAKAAAPAPAKAATIPQINTDEDFNALPSGTVFLDPQGNRRRKP